MSEDSGNFHLYAPPPDKSITIRAVLLAAFAEGKTEIINPLFCDDTEAALDCVRALGAEVFVRQGKIEIKGGKLHSPDKPLYCRSSGALARLLCGLIAGSGLKAEIDGSAQLRGRPFRYVIEPLGLMGADITTAEKMKLPVRIKPAVLHGIKYSMSVASAQVKSALLFAGVFAEGVTEITEPYLSRTHGENMLEMFSVPVERSGLTVSVRGSGFSRRVVSAETGFVQKSPFKACHIEIPGDFSSAAPFIAGAQLLKLPLRVRKTGLNPSRTGLVNVMKRAGAYFRSNVTDSAELCGTLDFYPAQRLDPVEVSAGEVPSLIDEIPLLAVLFAAAGCHALFYGVEGLKVKETDRLAAVIEIIRKAGATAEYGNGVLSVSGPFNEKAEFVVDAAEDHRMAMAATVASLVCHGIKIKGPDCVRKSYPGFFDDFLSVTGILPELV
ncbi:MAG: 3-phosphoshikimate 1-carboxyvinyltransferase [Elusimicrobiales bacterium]|nr:3-phosphoshikimate 1-carboxyvinyltransferase [Elusimicrobiales bacterium]